MRGGGNGGSKGQALMDKTPSLPAMLLPKHRSGTAASGAAAAIADPKEADEGTVSAAGRKRRSSMRRQ